MPSRASASIDSHYVARLAERRAQLAGCETRHVLWSRLRLGIVGVAVLMGVRWGLDLGWWWALPIVAFGAAMVLHARLLDARDRARRGVEHYERGLARLRHAWVGTGDTGERFRPADHPYAEDLDIFGRGSLFELLSSGGTEVARATLARWLLAAAPPDIVAERQAAVAELAALPDLRERLAVGAAGLTGALHLDALRRWAEASTGTANRALRGLILATSALVVATAAFAAWQGALTRWPARVLLATFVVQGAAALVLRARVVRAIRGLDTPAGDLAIVAQLFQTIARAPLKSPLAVRLASVLGDANDGAIREIGRLDRLVALLRSRGNILFALPAVLMAWTTQVGCAIDAWRWRAGRRLPIWLEAMGEFEALAALATFQDERRTYAVPTLIDGPATLEARAVAHPLLGDEAVANDFALGGSHPHLVVVSGSNMSGKSTFLRALGTNVVLALSGGPVRADALTMTPLVVGASIVVRDSVQDGKSRFFAEILRLKSIVDAARAHRGRVLFLLDEILGGTNSHDRRIGAAALAEHLIDAEAIGLLTTHDLALGAIADARPQLAINAHFADQFDGGGLNFDYQLRPGIVRTSNAIELMKRVGLIEGVEA